MFEREFGLEPKAVEHAYDALLTTAFKDDALPFAEAVKLGKHGGKREKGKQGNNITLTRGTDPSYILARLRRDHPELAEQVEAGTLSANAAAIQAGFRTGTFQISLNTTPEKAATKIREKFGDDFANQLKELL